MSYSLEQKVHDFNVTLYENTDLTKPEPNISQHTSEKSKKNFQGNKSNFRRNRFLSGSESDLPGGRSVKWKIMKKKTLQNIQHRIHSAEKPDSHKHSQVDEGKPNSDSNCGEHFSAPSTPNYDQQIPRAKKSYSPETPVRSQRIERPFSCQICKKTFKLRHHLSQHRESHSETKPFSSKQCGKSFTNGRYLNRQTSVHTGKLPHHCTVCGKGYGRRDHLTVHMRSHTGERPHIRKECGKSYSSIRSLNRHNRVHSGVRPCVCKECGESFRYYTSLYCHMRLHSAEKPNPSKA